MAFPKLPAGPLGPDARRNWLRVNIKLDTWRTQSANAIYEVIKGTELGIRRTDFLALRRQVLGLERFEEQFATLGSTTLAPASWMEADHGRNIKLQAQYRFKVPTLDLETGEVTIETRAISSDQWYTREEAEEAMWDHLAGDMSKYQKEFLGIDLYSVWTQEQPHLQRTLG